MDQQRPAAPPPGGKGEGKMEEESRGQRIKKVEEDDGNIREPAVPQDVGSAAEEKGIGKDYRQPKEQARLGVFPSQDENGEPDQITEQADEKIDQGEGHCAVEGGDLGAHGFDIPAAAQCEGRPIADLFLSQDELDVLRLLDLGI